MTQEEKQLLLKDLCARLSYGTIIHTWYGKSLDIKYTGINVYTNTVDLDIPDDDDAYVYVDNVKPYLRPMSSMTEIEKEELRALKWTKLEHYTVDWLNVHHFDYRGLIEEGLALEAPEGMYNN